MWEDSKSVGRRIQRSEKEQAFTKSSLEKNKLKARWAKTVLLQENPDLQQKRRPHWTRKLESFSLSFKFLVQDKKGQKGHTDKENNARDCVQCVTLLSKCKRMTLVFA